MSTTIGGRKKDDWTKKKKEKKGNYEIDSQVCNSIIFLLQTSRWPWKTGLLFKDIEQKMFRISFGIIKKHAKSDMKNDREHSLTTIDYRHVWLVDYRQNHRN